ncbi:semaphorin-4C [Hemiscyllium ocellatum]|uniref:semaphorin-4C n=1 Tax=Hemiscyllium ocellatum TaxID=170820 RepID=UPI002966BE89|nr:semaphorin-4C [Hemiscyllium ocellatum]
MGSAVIDLCRNVITVIERLNVSTIIICGTHAGNPSCWFLHDNGTQLATDREGHGIVNDGRGISPPSPTQPHATIAVEGSLYSATSDSLLGNGAIQRRYGRLRSLRTEDKWLQAPGFVEAAWIKMKDSSKDEIYFLFSETDGNEASERAVRSCIGRVCKVDEGASKSTQDSWTTFLKAQLLCGFPAELRYFNRIQDASVLLVEGEPQRSTVYGIFTSLWNASAICAYSQADIDGAFKNPKLKGFTGNLPASPKPGTCGISNVPRNVLTAIRNHPEIEVSILPMKDQPLYVVKHTSYTKITADQVKGANHDYYPVLFIGTGNGKIHKVLHNDGESFIISELSPFQTEAPVSAMTLDPGTGHLFVGTPLETVRLPLANCEAYGSTCWQCVAARDPYCGWHQVSKTCAPVAGRENDTESEILQSIKQLNVSVCDGEAGLMPFKEEPKMLTVHSPAYLYLPCPVKSFHAVYTWSYNQEDRFSCSIQDDSCPLIFNRHLPVSSGEFRCIASEDGLEEVLAVYNVRFSGGTHPDRAGTAITAGLLVALSLV